MVNEQLALKVVNLVLNAGCPQAVHALAVLDAVTVDQVRGIAADLLAAPMSLK